MPICKETRKHVHENFHLTLQYFLVGSHTERIWRITFHHVSWSKQMDVDPNQQGNKYIILEKQTCCGGWCTENATFLFFPTNQSVLVFSLTSTESPPPTHFRRCTAPTLLSAHCSPTLLSSRSRHCLLYFHRKYLGDLFAAVASQDHLACKVFVSLRRPVFF